VQENIFFNLRDIKKLGKNTIIGKTVRLRKPELCIIGKNSIIDDFTYISTKFNLGTGSHIATHVTIAGGSEFTCYVGDFSGIGSGSRLYCDSSDFTSEITSIIPKQCRLPTKAGDILMKKYTGIGGNSIILPNVTFNEGAVLGSLSLVPADMELKSWTLYAGIPAKPIRERNKKVILKQVEAVKAEYKKIN